MSLTTTIAEPGLAPSSPVATRAAASYAHRGDDHPLLGCTIDGHFRAVVERFPDQESVVSIAQASRVTYRELDALVDDVARGLLALGIDHGDRVGVWSTDNLEWVLLQLATARVGAVLVNVNPALRPDELRYALVQAEITALFMIPSFRKSDYVDMLCDQVPELRTAKPDRLEVAKLPRLRAVVVWDPADLDRNEPWAPGLCTWRQFLARATSVPEKTLRDRTAGVDADDPVNIQFTSGTTGFPKAVVLTHHNILNNAFFTARALRFTEHDRLCVPVPFYHCFGMVVSNLVCLTHGACIVIPSDHFEPGATLRAIEDERCTALHGVPTMFLAELDHPEFSSFDLTSLRTGIMAGAPCPPDLMRRVMNDMGCREILIAYGQTESSPVATATHPGDTVERRLRTVGRLLPHQEMKVVDTETGHVVPRGVPGEICLRGYHVMRGYHGDPNATDEAIDVAGWLHTGDIGVIDDDGYLAITGRLKDMIIRGGENIYPAEIEAFYYEHPDVDEIAVFGVPDDRLGEAVGAWVRPKPGHDLDVESIKAFARDRIAHYKIPAHIWFVETFPTTVSGKIQKRRIRDAVGRWHDAGGEAAPHGVEHYIA